MGAHSPRSQPAFSRLMDAINAPGAVLDLEGVMLSGTPQLADMLATSRHRLPGLPFQQFVAPKERERYARLLALTAEHPANADEMVLQRADDEPLYAHLAVRRLRPPSPEVITLVAVDLTRLHVVERLEDELQAGVHERMELVHANLALHEDIRRRQIAEAALLVSEAKWRKLFRGSPVVVAVTGASDGVVREVNPAFLRTLGYEEEEVLGRPLAALGFWRDDRDQARWLEALRRQGRVTDLEHAFVTKTGEARVGLTSSERIDFEGGAAVLSVLRDVTEHKRAAAALAAQTHLMQAILDQAAEGITVRHASGRVAFVNAVARGRARLPPIGTTLEAAAEVWGENLDAQGRRIPIEDSPMGRALGGHASARVELQRWTPAGRVFLLSSAAPLKSEAGELLGAVAVTTDISQLKRTEERLRQAAADMETSVRTAHRRAGAWLQLLAGVLRVQAKTAVATPPAPLEELCGRLSAAALLHDQLCRTPEPDRVHLGEYLRAVLGGPERARVAGALVLDLPDAPIVVDADRALYLGLIVNELVVAARHRALRNGRQARLGIRLRRAADQLVLRVREEGGRLRQGAAAPVDLAAVRWLARRLRATVSVETAGAPTITVRFPDGGLDGEA